MPEYKYPGYGPTTENWLTPRAKTKGGYHGGSDNPAKPGTPVYAQYNGEIFRTGRIDGYGMSVVVKSKAPDGTIFYQLYGHLGPDPLPAPGTPVIADQPIPGRSSAPQSMFRIREVSRPVRICIVRSFPARRLCIVIRKRGSEYFPATSHTRLIRTRLISIVRPFRTRTGRRSRCFHLARQLRRLDLPRFGHLFPAIPYRRIFLGREPRLRHRPEWLFLARKVRHRLVGRTVRHYCGLLHLRARNRPGVRHQLPTRRCHRCTSRPRNLGILARLAFHSRRCLRPIAIARWINGPRRGEMNHRARIPIRRPPADCSA